MGRDRSSGGIDNGYAEGEARIQFLTDSVRGILEGKSTQPNIRQLHELSETRETGTVHPEPSNDGVPDLGQTPEISVRVRSAPSGHENATNADEEGYLILKLDPAVYQYKHDIRRFVDAMLYKLKIHAKKGRWDNIDTHLAFSKMIDEVKELDEALLSKNTVEVMLEAADVANFAMIVASIQVERGND